MVRSTQEENPQWQKAGGRPDLIWRVIKEPLSQRKLHVGRLGMSKYKQACVGHVRHFNLSKAYKAQRKKMVKIFKSIYLLVAEIEHLQI